MGSTFFVLQSITEMESVGYSRECILNCSSSHYLSHNRYLLDSDDPLGHFLALMQS